MNAVHFRFGSGPYFNLDVGGSETWLDWTVGIVGEVFVDQKFMGLFSLLFGAGMILFIDRASKRGSPRGPAEPLAQHAAAPDRHLPLPVVGGRCADGLCGIVALPARPAEAAQPRAHLPWCCPVPPVRRLCPHRAAPRRHDRRVAVRPLDAGRCLGRRGNRGPRPAWLLPARAGADPRRRRVVSHGLHGRRPAREDVSADRDCRACSRLCPSPPPV